MKRIIAVLLAVLFLTSVFSVPASASGEKIVVKPTVSSSILGRGDTFTVDFNLTKNAGFVTLGIEVIYDSNQLEIVCPKHVEGNNCGGSRSPVTNKFRPSNLNNSAADSQYHTTKPYKIMWAFSNAVENVGYTGLLATLTFKVKQGADLTDTAISVVVDQASAVKNGRYPQNSLSSSTATINIACKKHSFGDWKQIKAPTCAEKGIELRTCSGCKKEERRDIAYIEHKLGDWENEKAPTCTEEGVEIKKCSNKNCKYSETRKLSATGHKLGEWVTVKEPTCEKNGEQVRKCTDCSYSELREIISFNHKFAETTVIEEPTCTKTGKEGGRCLICNKEATNVIPAKGHKIENTVVVTPPTCTTEGKCQGVCSVCGEKNVEQVIPATGHSFGKAVVTKQATETETGVKTFTCTVCGEKKQEVIPKISADLESSQQSGEGDITVNAENSEKYLIILILGIIVIGLAAAVISVIKMKSVKR